MSAQEAKRLEGIPFVVDEIRKSFSKLKLKTAEVDLEVEGLIATKELRFISWMMSNDAHCDADSSRKSLEHWRRSRPESYAVLSYSLLNVQRLLESIDRLVDERLGPDNKSLIDLFAKQLSEYLDTLESVTSPS